MGSYDLRFSEIASRIPFVQAPVGAFIRAFIGNFDAAMEKCMYHNFPSSGICWWFIML